MNLKKKVLMTAGIVAAAAVAGGSTFATFNAQTTNPGNVFETGTMVMSNKVNTATACLSTGAGTSTDTNAFDCDTLFNVSPAAPGGAATTVHLTLKNEGSINASALKAFTSACTDADAAGETYHGTGSLCSTVQLYIQQTDSAFTAMTACLYGGAAVANTCDFSDTSKTLGDFATNYTNSTTGLAAGGALNAGASKYYIIGVKMPDVNNTFQGRSATIPLTWYMA